MITRRKKIITLVVVVGGIAVMLGAGISIKKPILEQWWLWKLKAGNLEEKTTAAKRLGELGSVKALHSLFAEIVNGDYFEFDFDKEMGMVLLIIKNKDKSEDSKPDVGCFVVRAISKIVEEKPENAVPKLIKELESKEAVIRGLASSYLGNLGPHAWIAIPPLQRCSRDYDRRVCHSAALALRKIQGRGVQKNDPQEGDARKRN